MTIEFAYLSLDRSDATLPPEALDCSANAYASIDDLFASKTKIMGIAIDTADAHKADTALRALRGNPETAVKPIFLFTPFEGDFVGLADGVAASMAEAFGQASRIHARLTKLDESLFEDREAIFFRLLAFLYARPGVSYEPVQHWSFSTLYRFSLVDALLGDEENSALWLRTLANRGLLQQGTLKDRIRLCPQCEKAHLNFVDICPNCTSIDIVQKPFLHCFACGHVAPEDAFIEKGYLGCPNCSARLRHIGADYDRALESYQCQACGHVFEESDVTAHCQHCGTKSRVTDLLPHNIYAYEITEQGVAAVKTGMLEDVYALLDRLDNINPKVFEAILDWLLKVNRRHADVSFSLIGIRLMNVLELTETIGRRRITELMDGFVSRIRELVRTTDLTMRNDRQNFWLLLPKTDVPGSRVVLERIIETQQYTRQEEGVALDINTVRFCAPDDALEGESAPLLLARLSGGLE
ncbi:hypothetical protein [uncultured Desulfosarcina sp.]|uniref:TackOD1 domain-containing metal-binding protein n=1 Tax=uncultured Desulfosarcina sp. TaxID=218289 RepID=UPI0029C7A42A|nr:hypothetical protein [uncultured Desulfosarcina sp.]